MLRDNSNEWIEEKLISKHRCVFTDEDINVSGINTFGWNKVSKAINALTTHYHADSYELTYVVAGTVLFQVDGIDYNLNGGDLLIVPPNVLHSTAQTPMTIHTIFWFQINTNKTNLLNCSSETSERIAKAFAEFNTATCIKIENEDILKYFKKSLSLLPVNNSTDSDKFALYIHMIIDILLENSTKKSKDVSQDIKYALSYIDENILNKITLEELAKTSMLSLPRFKQKFSDEIGTSPREYVNYIKVELAKEMLKLRRSVIDVAIDLSFSSSNYFCVVFKQFTKYTPTEYKKLHLNK